MAMTSHMYTNVIIIIIIIIVINSVAAHYHIVAAPAKGHFKLLRVSSLYS